MKSRALLKSTLVMTIFLSSAACSTGNLEDEAQQATVAQTAQATSLLGEPLYASAPSQSALEKFEEAKKVYNQSPNDPDALIWYGRRAAYLGDYTQAIDIFSMGVEQFPNDFRMLRHRGHRYISTRQFDKALSDFSKATELMLGVPDKTEPDGLPNAMNIPLTTTQGNIRYHLALTYYLLHDFENASRIFAEDLKHSTNDDGIVASTHWLYMSLRRQGKVEQANALLEPITEDMNIIENYAYHRACLFYKGIVSEQDIFANDIQGPGNAGLIYGLANWHLYEGNEEKARQIMSDLVDGQGWAAFGYIAAEADLVELQK